MNKKIERTILSMSHAYFTDKQATSEEITKFIKRAGDFYSEETIDKEWLFRKLFAIHLLP